MITLLAVHFLASAGAPALVRLLDRRAFLVLALVPAASLVWLAPKVWRGDTPTDRLPWVPGLHLDITLHLGPVGGPLSLLVTGIGALVLVYCGWYFKPGDPEIWRFTAVFTAFAGAMLGLVLADNVYLLYLFWELTTVLSFLLVGHNPERRANRRAAINALLVTTFGGLAMLAGLVIVHQETGSPLLSEIVTHPPEATATVQIAVGLLLVGAISKSALVPFHFWLPGAMAAPTPVSAYLHAAAMVKAGVFLVTVLAPAFADLSWWRPSLVALGLLTMTVGGLRALRQYDVKLLLAYGTVSQLGFLTLVAGLGTRSAAVAGLALVVAHALFKSTLFLVVGLIDRSTGTRDLRVLSGLWRLLPWPCAAAVVAGASMAGVPPLFGFVAKEAVLAALEDLDADAGTTWGLIALGGVVLGSILTVAYTARFVWGAFATKKGVEPPALTRHPAWFTVPPFVLALSCLAAGLLSERVAPLIERIGSSYPTGAHEPSLALWHGVNLPLLLSTLSVVGGVALFIARHPVAAAQHAVTDRVWLPEAEQTYYAFLRGLERLAVEVTGRVQRGSLPLYLTTILAVVTLAPGAMLVRAYLERGEPLDVTVANRPAQLVVALLIIGAAVATTRSRRRLRAVLLVGVTGYGTALMFILHGAPDLALTQILVETFLLVTFVLVLRRLPRFFSERPFTANRWLRVGAGVIVGGVVAGLALLMAASRTADPIGHEFAGPAVEYGGGHNIVNVTLVDIRAWDTLGELSVLVVAATGVASLIHLLTDRAERINRVPRSTGEARWLRRVDAVKASKRSLVFEVVTRLVFHAVIVYSVFIMLVGHNQPGGGFAGGLIAGLALAVRYLVGGRKELDAAAPVDAGLVLGLGLATAALSGLLPTLLGGGVLQSAIVDLHLGPLGDLHLVTSVFFDVGVYLVVVGLALDVLRSLGGGIDQQVEKEDEAVTLV
ncbi:MAG: Na+/H+ antiporter subunit A [Aeromicrobium sp.]|uniref:Na+/H+ antiporter subunit A n=1 Tax=Aeromicrobium sp. TaxID=1871063 RepID=UPI0039E726C7